MLAIVAAAGLLACAPPVRVPAATTQLIAVTAPTRRATRATLELWAKVDGCWTRAAGPWAARVGRNGVSAHHREGDGTTPLGTFAIGPVMYGVAADPGVAYPYHRLRCGDWWDGDPRSVTYNTFRHVACGRRPPFRGNSEALWEQTRAYRYFAVVHYNSDPVVPGRGSAVFLHADTRSATSGCVSLPLRRLVETLRWLRPDAKPVIAIRVG